MASLGRPKDPKTEARRAAKKAEEKSLRVPREFTKAELGRMFSAREDGVSDEAIARRFGISTDRLRELIGPRQKKAEVWL